METVKTGQPNIKPRATRQCRPSSASRKSTSGGSQLKRLVQPSTRGPLTNGNSQSTKQARLPVQPSASHPSSANAPVQPTIQPTPGALAQSVRAVVPNAIEVDPLEYMLDAFNNCISQMLVMPRPLKTFIRIRVYHKMFADFERQELVSLRISTIVDRGASCTRCFTRLRLPPPHSGTI